MNTDPPSHTQSHNLRDKPDHLSKKQLQGSGCAWDPMTQQEMVKNFSLISSNYEKYNFWWKILEWNFNSKSGAMSNGYLSISPDTRQFRLVQVFQKTNNRKITVLTLA